jgi:hypothetical protein
MAHRWGEQYNQMIENIFTVEEEMSREISEQLRLNISGAQKKRLTRRYTENTEAYQCYLKGRFHWNKRTEEAMKRGIEYFEQAIEVDPGYALAYAGLADSYNLLASYSMLASSDAFPRAKAAARRALELDEGLQSSRRCRSLFGYEWDWEGAAGFTRHRVEPQPGAPVERGDACCARQVRGSCSRGSAQELDRYRCLSALVIGPVTSRDYDAIAL